RIKVLAYFQYLALHRSEGKVAEKPAFQCAQTIAKDDVLCRNIPVHPTFRSLLQSAFIKIFLSQSSSEILRHTIQNLVDIQPARHLKQNSAKRISHLGTLALR